MLRTAGLLLASTILVAAPAQAQRILTDEPPHGTKEHDHTGAHDIVVTAPYQGGLDILAGKSVLRGEDLQREVRTQIGETLVRLPGVSATSFGPGSSRPVLRGFQGERVRVLTDGLGTIDVSNTSADHAVTIDPLTAERVEVLRGPAALLFGGQAIGGAVNVIDRRIPRAVPRNGYHVDVLGALGTAADERSIGAAVDVALGGGLVAHVGGSYRKTDDLRVGGYVLSPRLRAEQLEIAAEELEEGHAEEAEEALELANQRGRLPNSATEQKTFDAGFAYIRGPLSLGASFSRFESDYGIAKRPGAEHDHGGEEEEHEEDEGHEHGDEDVSIGLKQNRFDLRGEYDLGGALLDRIRLRVGAVDYEHTEFEGDEIGTVFKSDGFEGRLELVQAERNGWRGASGVQLFRREFNAIGPEAFLGRNDTFSWGLFTLQELSFGAFGIEGAARFDRSRVESPVFDVTRTFNAFSAAAGVHYDVAERARVGLNLSRTERAPSAEELFSNGPHLATQAFEIGDPRLRKEKSWGVEAYFRLDREAYSFNATAYANRFDDFIYESETGLEEDELPVFRYLQRDATYKGFEVEASARLFRVGGVRVIADGVLDYVRATIKNGGPVPRIPPLRLLAGLEAQSNFWDARAELEWFDDQTRVAAFETPTDGFTLVNASLAWHPWGKRNETTVILSANNIFDVDARRHASFTKEFVPLAGRDIRLSARFSF